MLIKLRYVSLRIYLHDKGISETCLYSRDERKVGSFYSVEKNGGRYVGVSLSSMG